MIVETLLPLGKLDPGLREPDTPLDIRDFAALAKVAEDVGVGAVLVEETKDDPYQLLALGAAATSEVQLGTSVAIAFPAQPDRHGDVGMVAAEAVERPLPPGPGNPGPGARPASVRAGVARAGTVDARLRRCNARRVAHLADR